jgi:hypothetical protein
VSDPGAGIVSTPLPGWLVRGHESPGPGSWVQTWAVRVEGGWQVMQAVREGWRYTEFWAGCPVPADTVLAVIRTLGGTRGQH